MHKVTRTVVLVTGSSSGLGRACADLLAESSDHAIYGASRTEPKDHAWTHIPMDVTCDDSVARAMAQIFALEGRIDAVVHCAGNSVAGAIETTSIVEAQRQFETNYFGAVRVINSVLPSMRAQRSGKIVLVGSIAGLISLPFQAHYSATKFALDALVEALRVEIAPFGVQATVVHPGDFDTEFGKNRRRQSRVTAPPPYGEAFAKALSFYEAAEKGGGSPPAFARRVKQVLARRRLPPKVIVGMPLEVLGVFGKAWLPSRVFEFMFGLLYLKP